MWLILDWYKDKINHIYIMLNEPFAEISRRDGGDMTQEDYDSLFEFGGLFLVFQLYDNYIKGLLPL